MSRDSSPILATGGGSLDILQILYPGARAGVGDGEKRLIAIPSPAEARIVLPDRARLSGRAFRRMRRPKSRLDQAASSTTARMLTMGAASALPAKCFIYLDESQWSIEDELSKVLGLTVRAGIFLGPVRANRKPVLHLYDPDGDLVAIVKVGVNELTAQLARAEGMALRQLARIRMTTVIVPRLLVEHEWRGLTMVAQSPLKTWGYAKGTAGEVRRRAFLEIARVGGVSTGPLRSSPYVHRLRSQVEQLDDDLIRAKALDVLRRIESRAPIEFGSWHGDLTDWNMAVEDRHALVWDWERFASEVPVGFDALHHDFLPSTKGSVEASERAGIELVQKAGFIVGPMGVDRTAAEVVAILYLIEIAARFTKDGQAATGVRGGEARHWLVPALDLYRAELRGRS